MPDQTPLTDLLNKIHHADCFDLLARVPDGSIDAIITDLPYQVTAMSWDQIIPFAPMWAEVKRVLKPRGVFVTTASQPFTSALVMSNPAWFRYEWIWEKTNAVDFMIAQIRPRKLHENILVFSEQTPPYYPQMEIGEPYIDKPRKRTNNVHDSTMPNLGIVNLGTRYPSSIQRFSNGNNFVQHPTQKPLNLFEYLIRTYTQPGELVLDFCAGSGTTALAARNTGRRFIAGDSDATYCAIARDRLRLPFEPREVVKKSAPLTDLPLFATLAVGD